MNGIKVRCFGGFLHGLDVDNFGDYYSPLSEKDHRDYWSLSASEQDNFEPPIEKYHLNITGHNDLHFFIYLWNNDEAFNEKYLSDFLKEKLAN
ncbi:hypothetical protein ACG95P_09700 [Acinetobacter guillouiae]|uniref:hypothetical protein n=1 Tax=Acinetobacter guillouiae TaxID=106649 RepID=UPI003AF64C2E